MQNSHPIVIHGVPMLLKCGISSVCEALSRRFRAYITTSKIDPKIHVHIGEATDWSRTAARQVPHECSWSRTRPLWARLQEDTLYLSDGASLATVQYSNQCAEYLLDPRTLEDRLFFERTFLYLPLLELLRTEGLFYLHGAAVVSSSRCVLLLGDGGSGKSTMAAGLMKAGWQLIADDNLLVQETIDGRCRVVPFEQEISISPEIKDQLNLNGGGTMDGKKWRAPVTELPDSSVRDSATPTDIVCLVEGDQDGLRPADRSDLFRQIVEDNPLLLLHPKLATPHTRALQTLISSAKPWQASVARKAPVNLVDISRRFLAQFEV